MTRHANASGDTPEVVARLAVAPGDCDGERARRVTGAGDLPCAMTRFALGAGDFQVRASTRAVPKKFHLDECAGS